MLLIKKEKKLKSAGKILLRIVSWPVRWIASKFINEWEVVIWIDPQKKTSYNFKWLDKCEPKHLKGRLVTGEPFELKTQDAFNYQIRKVK